MAIMATLTGSTLNPRNLLLRVGAINEADSARIADAFDAISRGVVDLIATTAPVPCNSTDTLRG